MRIDVNVDAAQLLLRMRNGEKRMAYAVVNAINDTMKQAQAEIRDEKLYRSFTVRPKGEALLRRRVAKLDFARVGGTGRAGRAFAEIYVDATGLQGGKLLLPHFEAGGPRPAFKGKTSAVPITGGPARPSFPESVPETFFIRKLGLRLRPRLRGGGRGRTRTIKSLAKRGVQPVRYGLEGTYQIPGVGIFRRRPGQKVSELVYAFRQVQLPPRLGFVETVTGVIDRNFQRNLLDEVFDTLTRRRA